MLTTKPASRSTVGPHRQHEHEQQQSENQVGLAQALDALVQPGDHRRKGDSRDAGDDQHPGRVGVRHAEQMGQPRRRLLGAQPERGGQPEERGEHGEHVDEMAEPAPHPLAQDRIEGRPQRQRQPQVVGGEGERERHDREHRPRVHAPVIDGRGNGEPVRGGGIRGVDPERRIPEMVDGLRHAEEHQADADPGREQHGEPGPGGVVGPGIRTAQAHAADRRRQQEQAEQDEEVPRAHEHPVERRGEPGVQRVEDARGGVPEGQHPR